MTKRALQRLGYQATRDPRLTVVLHDALLESPATAAAYECAIRLAEEDARHTRNRVAVLFRPRTLVGRVDRSLGPRMFTIAFLLESENAARRAQKYAAPHGEHWPVVYVVDPDTRRKA